MHDTPQALSASLAEQLRDLHGARLSLANAQRVLAEREDAFRRETAAQRDLVAALKASIQASEAGIRMTAEGMALETGIMKPAAGVEVKRLKSHTIDEGPALEWAIAHRLALALDRKAIEKIAQATPLPFVTVHEVPKAFIATDLAKALGLAEVTSSAPAAATPSAQPEGAF